MPSLKEDQPGQNYKKLKYKGDKFLTQNIKLILTNQMRHPTLFRGGGANIAFKHYFTKEFFFLLFRETNPFIT